MGGRGVCMGGSVCVCVSVCVGGRLGVWMGVYRGGYSTFQQLLWWLSGSVTINICCVPVCPRSMCILRAGGQEGG